MRGTNFVYGTEACMPTAYDPKLTYKSSPKRSEMESPHTYAICSKVRCVGDTCWDPRETGLATLNEPEEP